jgi:hypothetical protein
MIGTSFRNYRTSDGPNGCKPPPLSPQVHKRIGNHCVKSNIDLSLKKFVSEWAQLSTKDHQINIRVDADLHDKLRKAC